MIIAAGEKVRLVPFVSFVPGSESSVRKRKHRVTWRYPMFSGGEKNLNLNTAVIGNRASALESKFSYFFMFYKGYGRFEKNVRRPNKNLHYAAPPVNFSLSCTPGKP